jgi:hypothetical protein
MRIFLFVAIVFSCAPFGCGSSSAATQQPPNASADAVADSPDGDSPSTEAASGDSVSPDESDPSSDVITSDGNASSAGPSDASGDSLNDAKPADATADSPALDAGDFFSNLPGIWLIGWSGNLNHYSWVRLGTGTVQGLAEYLPGADLPVNAPYWNCTGAGSWMLTPQKPNNVSLMFPAACALPPLVLTFDSFSSPTGRARNATLLAHVSSNPSTLPLDGWKFPPSQCNQAMTSCTNPL